MTGCPRLTRLLVAAAGVLLSAVPAAASHGGAGTSYGFLNQYFLPAHAQISGTSGLIFGVFLPFLIVAILLYTVLKEIELFPDRQAKALGVIIALFIIPSGGYQVISQFFIGIFTVGSVSGGGLSLAIPGVGKAGTDLLLAVVAFGATALFLNKIVVPDSKSFTPTEYIASAGAGFIVWLALSGGVGIVSTFLGWIIMLWLGWEVFKRGTGAGGLTGIGVGIVGLFILFSALARFDFLPESVQNVAGAVAGGLPVVVVLIAIVTGVVLALLIMGT